MDRTEQEKKRLQKQPFRENRVSVQLKNLKSKTRDTTLTKSSHTLLTEQRLSLKDIFMMKSKVGATSKVETYVMHIEPKPPCEGEEDTTEEEAISKRNIIVKRMELTFNGKEC